MTPALLPLALGLALVLAGGAASAQDAPALHALEQQARELRSQDRTGEAMAVAAQWLALEQAAHGATHLRVAAAHEAVGDAQRQAGLLAAAERSFAEALRIVETLRGADHPENTRQISRLARIYSVRGNFTRAEALRLRALRIAEAGREPQILATHLNNLGVLYARLGQPGKAEPLYERALALAEATRGKDSASADLYRTNLAAVYRRTGRHAQAEALLRESMTAAQARNPRSAEVARRQANLALVLEDIGRPAEALALAQQAHAILVQLRGPHHPGTGAVLHQLGRLHHRLGEVAASELLFRQAMAVLGTAESGRLRFECQRDFARFLAGRGVAARAEAIFVGKLAVNAFQQIRADADGLDDELQRGLLQFNLAIYQETGEWLVAAGRLAEAEEILSLLKGKELEELTRRSGGAAQLATMTGPEAELERRHTALGDEAVRTARELEALNLQLRRGTALSAQEQARRQELQSVAEQQRVRMQAFFGDLQQQLSADPRAAQAARDQLERGARQLQTLLRRAGPGHAGLQYVITEERLSIILTLPEGSVARQVGLPRAELNRRIAALRQALKSPAGDARPAARALYDSLVAPVAKELAQANAHTLVLSLTDALRYVPFAALYDGERYLLQSYALGVHTPAATQALQPADAARWRAAGLGLTRAVTVAEDNRAFSALPAVAQELRHVVRSAESPAGAMPGSIALDADFTRARLEAALPDHPVLHVASHFQFSPGSEQQSYLVLGDGSRMTLAELREMDFTGTELLTLSACETASGGGRNERGSEVEGLGAALQAAGARTVLATLWPVADASTALLMQRFYAARMKGGGSGAQSLREAQLVLLSGAAGSAATGAERGARNTALSASAAAPAGHAHPFFWAPFVLMGNWL